MLKFIITLALGFFFGSILLASQAFSWYRIQEMFHFDSFHMYGVLGSAIATGSLSVFLIKKFKIKSITGNPITLKPKPLKWKSNIFGGLIFGVGWGLSGACSAPIFILLGNQWQIGIFLFLGALIGAFIYGLIEKKLP
jgi:uncharacterized membrane protein YedE/YeeE